ncbi:MAG: hypothetical protein PUB66_08430, partial [Oscillospiraceae bacterium]|nr:hypothetical protein [Oscillospiraceae bacterium]
RISTELIKDFNTWWEGNNKCKLTTSEKSSSIVILNDYLQRCEITEDDMMNTIKKYSRKKSSLLLIDPPYLLTNGNYTNNESEFKFHEKTAILINKCNCKFVLYYRVTASKFSGINQNKQLADDVLKCFYYNHYSGKGYYYCDIPLKHGNDVTMERMLTNLDMSTYAEWNLF